MVLFHRTKPKIKTSLADKREGFSGWSKCPQCSEIIHDSELEKNLFCCPKCDHHHRLSADKRIEMLTDKKSFKEYFSQLSPIDALGFVDTEPYSKRLKIAQQKAGRDEAVVVGLAKLDGQSYALGVMDFSFMGGSMGSVVGERLVRLIELAIKRSLPVVIVCASGGARMQESILSLMQMAKISAALGRLHEKGLAYIAILTNPTTGGVTASFAALGDVILAEPKALIGFAGARVIEQTMKQSLPPGAQRSEFLLDHGMVDRVVGRANLRKELSLFLNYFNHKKG